jgi:hypothetical protein
MGNRLDDIVGQTFNRLTVLSLKEIDPENPTKPRRAICRCECGAVREFAASDVKRGHSKSCGCLQLEAVKSTMTTHGATVGRMPRTEYRIWSSMKERCTNPKCKRYGDYGGRGIRVCDRWLSSFSLFYEDMGKKPSKSHSLDRIDNNLGYSKDNCRWATSHEQGNNTRTNRFIHFNGHSLTIAEWSRKTGISRSAISARLKLGWAVSEALLTPVNPSNKLVTLRNKAID